MARPLTSLGGVYGSFGILGAAIIATLIVSSITLNNINGQNDREASALVQLQSVESVATFNTFLVGNTTTNNNATGTCVWEIVVYAVNGTVLSSHLYTGARYDIQTHTSVVTTPEPPTETVVAESIVLYWPTVYISINAPVGGVRVSVGRFSFGQLPFANGQLLPLGTAQVLAMEPSFPSCNFPASSCAIGASTVSKITQTNLFQQGTLNLRTALRTYSAIVNHTYTSGFVFKYYNNQQQGGSLPSLTINRDNATSFQLSLPSISPLDGDADDDCTIGQGYQFPTWPGPYDCAGWLAYLGSGYPDLNSRGVQAFAMQNDNGWNPDASPPGACTEDQYNLIVSNVYVYYNELVPGYVSDVKSVVDIIKSLHDFTHADLCGVATAISNPPSNTCQYSSPVKYSIRDTWVKYMSTNTTSTQNTLNLWLSYC